jgi:DNA-binding NarL/FixJ family response regulator
MHALVIDDDPNQQDKYLEVLSWFSAVKMVLLATNPSDVTLLSSSPFGAVLVGQLGENDQEKLVRLARQLHPNAKIIAAVKGDASERQSEHLRRAGADSTVDSRISIWKTGLMLRKILWDNDSPARASRVPNQVPGLWIETV